MATFLEISIPVTYTVIWAFVARVLYGRWRPDFGSRYTAGYSTAGEIAVGSTLAALLWPVLWFPLIVAYKPKPRPHEMQERIRQLERELNMRSY